MAKVCFCRDGDNPTDGGPRAVLPLDDCAKTLGLTGADYIGDLTEVPKFGKSGDPLAMIRGYQPVVVAVSDAEAAPPTWRSGYYRARLTPPEAMEKS
jgi:hypothetical protein